MPSLELLSLSSPEALISLDLIRTKLYCFRAKVDNFLSQSSETFRRAS